MTEDGQLHDPRRRLTGQVIDHPPPLNARFRATNTRQLDQMLQFLYVSIMCFSFLLSYLHRSTSSAPSVVGIIASIDAQLAQEPVYICNQPARQGMVSQLDTFLHWEKRGFKINTGTEHKEFTSGARCTT